MGTCATGKHEKETAEETPKAVGAASSQANVGSTSGHAFNTVSKKEEEEEEDEEGDEEEEEKELDQSESSPSRTENPNSDDCVIPGRVSSQAADDDKVVEEEEEAEEEEKEGDEEDEEEEEEEGNEEDKDEEQVTNVCEYADLTKSSRTYEPYPYMMTGGADSDSDDEDDEEEPLAHELFSARDRKAFVGADIVAFRPGVAMAGYAAVPGWSSAQVETQSIPSVSPLFSHVAQKVHAGELHVVEALAPSEEGNVQQCLRVLDDLSGLQRDDEDGVVEAGAFGEVSVQKWSPVPRVLVPLYDMVRTLINFPERLPREMTVQEMAQVTLQQAAKEDFKFSGRCDALLRAVADAEDAKGVKLAQSAITQEYYTSTTEDDRQWIDQSAAWLELTKQTMTPLDKVFVKQQPRSRQFVFEVACLAAVAGLVLPTPKLLAIHEDKARMTTTTLLELSGGEAANQFFKTDRQQPVEVKVRAAMMFAFALQCCHAELVVHNDVALKNFMTDGEKCFDIVDFGLSQVGDKAYAEEHGTSGEMPYVHAQAAVLQAAPELLERRVCSPATDMFQFGWVLHEMMEGSDGTNAVPRFVRERIAPLYPSGGLDVEERREAFGEFVAAVKSVRPESPEYPHAAYEVVLRLLDPDPATRMTASEAVAALGTLVDGVSEEEVTVLAESKSMVEASFRLHALGYSQPLAHPSELLRLQKSEIGQDSASEFLAKMKQARTDGVEELNLENNSGQVLGPGAARAFVRVLPSLCKLKMDNTRVFSDSALGELLSGGELASLHISAGGVTNLRPLAAALKGNQALIELGASMNTFSDVSPLAEVLKTNEVLETLDISYSDHLVNISPLGEALRANQTLQTLNLSWCKRLADITPLAEALTLNHSLQKVTVTQRYCNERSRELADAEPRIVYE